MLAFSFRRYLQLKLQTSFSERVHQPTHLGLYDRLFDRPLIALFLDRDLDRLELWLLKERDRLRIF
jgi:hypothetical protein